MAKQDVTVELFYSGVWHDITLDVLVRDQITITRGRSEEGGSLRPPTCELSINNGVSNINGVVGRYSPRNPRSDLFGLIGRNTPLRVYFGTPHPGASNFDLADTTDHVAPSLDSPTDDALLMCAWAAPEPGESYTLPTGMTAAGNTTDTRTTMDSAHELISAVGPTGTRTATLSVTEDYLAASVLLHGNSPTVEAFGGFSVILSNISGEAGNWWVVVSYFGWDGTAMLPTPNAPGDTDGSGWILLADTGHLEPVDAHADSFRMKAWAKRIKTTATHQVTMDNPGGDLDSIQSVLWEVQGVDDWSIRFTGEVANWPPRWDLSGNDRWVPIQAAGRNRRDGRVQTSLRNTVNRFAVGQPSDPLLYVPLDDDKDQIIPTTIIGPDLTKRLFDSALDPQFGQGRIGDHLPATMRCRTPEPSWGDLSLTRLIAGPVISTSTTWRMEFVYRWEEGGGEFAILGITGNGIQFTLEVAPTVDPGDRVGIHVFDLEANSTVLFADTVSEVLRVFDGRPHHLAVLVEPSVMTLYIDGEAEPLDNNNHGTTGELEYSILQYQTQGTTNTGVFKGASDLGHWLIWNGNSPPVTDVARAVFGYTGETASERISRILAEEAIPHSIIGLQADEEVVLGPQYAGQLLALIQEAATTGGGWRYEPREFRGYTYRTIGSAYNQPSALQLDYAAAEVGPPLQPTEDDQATANDVVAKRRGGGEVRRMQTSGPLNVNDPADDDQGVGRYDTSMTVNVLADGHPLRNRASWRLHLGTVDEPRYPTIVVDLDATPGLVDAAAAVDVADRITIDNPPSWLPPELITQLAIGSTETIGSHRRRIAFVGAPESPYHIAEVAHAQFSYIGSDGTTVRSTDFDTGSNTLLDVDIAEGYLFWDDGDAPFDIVVSGARLTVTGIAMVSSQVQRFTVDQAPVNGVEKRLPVGAPVDVFHKSYIGL